jgi:hypothetical protein
LVPSLATAAVEERIAGTIPAAAAKIGLRDACSAVLATPNDAEESMRNGTCQRTIQHFYIA